MPGLLEPFMPFKAAVLRTGGLALLAIALIERGWSLRTRGSDSLPSRLAVIAVTAWVAVAVLSWTLNGSLRLGLLGEIEQREGVLTLLGLAGLFAGTRRCHREPDEVRTTLDVVIVCASLAAAYALVQFAGRDPIPWANAYDYTVRGLAVSRPSGTLGNPILLGAVLAPALALALARLASGHDPWRLAPLIALMSAALTATLSRGSWLAGVVGGGAALAGIAILDGRRRWIGGAALAALVPVGLFVILPLRNAVLARLDEQTLHAVTSLDVRAEIARGALSLWRSHPWLGVGPDAFGLRFPSVQTPALWRSEWIGLPVHAHSVPLQILATLGVLGAVAGFAWVIATLMAARTAWQRLPEQRADGVAMTAALGALLTAGALNVVGLAAAALFAVLSGMLIAAGAPAGTSEPARGLTLARAAALVAASAVVIASGLELRALAIAGQARDAFLQTTTAVGLSRSALVSRSWQLSSRAAEDLPGEDELWRIACDAALAEGEGMLARGDTAEAGGAAERAGMTARRAVECAPARTANLERLGNALALHARTAREPGAAARFADRADSVFAVARRLAPADGRLLASESRAALAMRRPERALAAARRITGLYPEAATGHALEAAALLVMHRDTDARAALRRAVLARWEPGLDSQRPAVVAMLAALDRADSLRAWGEASASLRASPPASR